jgi:hypothetical protein
MTSEIQAAANQIQAQTLYQKLNALSALVNDLLENHRNDDGMEDFALDDVCADISRGIQGYIDYHDDKEHAGDDTPEQTQAFEMQGG